MTSLTQKFALVLNILSMCLLGACANERSDNVNQDRVRTDYSVDFDAATSELTADATFYFGSTYLELTSPASVSYNGKTLAEDRNWAGQISYRQSTSASASQATSATHSFDYTNNSSAHYSNSTQMKSIAAGSNSLSVASGGSIAWSGDNSTNDTSALIELTQSGVSDNAIRITKSIVINAGGTSSTATFTAKEMTDALAVAGSYKLQICRYGSATPVDAPGAGGSLTWSYCTANTTVQIQ